MNQCVLLYTIYRIPRNLYQAMSKNWTVEPHRPDRSALFDSRLSCHSHALRPVVSGLAARGTAGALNGAARKPVALSAALSPPRKRPSQPIFDSSRSRPNPVVSASEASSGCALRDAWLVRVPESGARASLLSLPPPPPPPLDCAEASSRESDDIFCKG
mmetsp:Transcript_18358/g.47011  ORF Transcript_18358/g.47011 Transcript_18358/m.47011 type:complete len:159 (-) Transcript_18358:320-796(-)